MSYLRLRDREAWTACPGRPALEATEGGRPDDIPTVLSEDRKWWDERKAALEAQGASVEVHVMTRLDVGAITGEAGALGWGTVILATYHDRSTLEVYPPDPLLALAAVLKYGLVAEFASTNCGTPDELHIEGAKITEAAALALSLRDSVTALEHLVAGPYCGSCLAAYHCPALKRHVHQQVHGKLQAPDEPALIVPSLRSRLDEGQTMRDMLTKALAQLPAIEGYVAQVRAHAKLARLTVDKATAPVPKKRRRRRGSGKTPANPT